MPGPAPKPTALRLVEGGGKLRAVYRRRAKGEPRPREALGEPPAYFKRDQLQVWFRLEAGAPAGLLTAVDREIFEAFVVITAAREKLCKQFLEDNRKILIESPDDKNRLILDPYLREYRRFSEQLRVLAQDLGFTPAARTRITLPEGDAPEDLLAQFLGQAG